ncbi:uncharacterized protein LOC125946505 isoform X1 [Dermacentor silvarum]|uniref:uncharacterized protein LOC125946505 isoform X1 n=1 Tax=Dermacentor silvarum TaxID=543639 RepID=UPI002100EB7E|nr:uncharacterized protein LOC125946505 isoform X1 [Dermacentor silvarum]
MPLTNLPAMLGRPKAYRMFQLLLVIILATTIFRVSMRRYDDWSVSGLCTRYAKWECRWIHKDTCPPVKVKLLPCIRNGMLDCTEWKLRSGLTFCVCQCGGHRTAKNKNRTHL